MRITSGVWRGRPLRAPDGLETRPTQDRVRAAFFDMLGGTLPGGNFLDLFAGSGAIGFEALSRGVERCVFVESMPRHAACISANAKVLDAVSRIQVAVTDAYLWPRMAGRGYRFPYGFADPPYALAQSTGWVQLLEDLACADVIALDGFLALEMGYRQDAPTHVLWELCRDRVYGQTRLAIYRRRSDVSG